MGAVFGEEYADGRIALAILCVGQLTNALVGSVGFLLNMTGNERDVAKGFAIAAIINIALNLVLIPLFGIEGAAFATAVSMMVWNVLLYRQARAKLGIDSSVMSIVRNDEHS